MKLNTNKTGQNITKHSKKNLKTGKLNTQMDVLKQILEWVREGNTRVQIMELCLKEWEMKLSTANLYYYRALDLLKCTEPEDVQREVAKLEEMYLDLYKRARERKDYNTARLVLENVSKLKGLNVEKVQHEMEIKIEF